MTRRALILGTLPGQAEAIHWLKRTGWEVHACGYRDEGPGVAAADEFHLTDIVDVDGVTRLAETLEVNVVYSVGSDIAMPTVARVSERLGLRTFHDAETTDLLQRKESLRRFLNFQGLSPVAFVEAREVSDLAAFTSYPAVLKPSDSQGQRGISVVRTADEARIALEAAVAASSSGVAILEEWLDGPEISIHVMVIEGTVRFYVPSDRHTWEGPILGVAEAHVMPSTFLSESDGLRTRSLVENTVTALGIHTGPLYFQIKLTSSGPRIVEIASRLDGCHLWRLIEIHTGFDLLGACFRLLDGEAWQEPAPWDDARTRRLRLLLSDPTHPFDPLQHPVSAAERCLYEYLYLEEGQTPRVSNGVIERVGYRILEDGS